MTFWRCCKKINFFDFEAKAGGLETHELEPGTMVKWGDAVLR